MDSLNAFVFISTAYVHGKKRPLGDSKQACGESLRPLRVDPYKIANSIQRTAGRVPFDFVFCLWIF
jgi:hypothetical protein